jgi:tetratricopeptide (TPR) repeat protein
MKFYRLLLAVLLFSACSSPAPVTFTSPTTKEAALVRMTEQLTVLYPVVKQTVTNAPISYFVDKPEANKANPLEEATQALRESPDALNKLAEITPFDPLSLGSKTDKAAQLAQLQSLLKSHPNLDLGWVWLASSQKDHAQAAASLSKAIVLNGQIGYYFRRRALMYVLLHKYPEAVRDGRKAVELYHDRTELYKELADIYAIMQDDLGYEETSNLYLNELQSTLSRIEKISNPDWWQLETARRLREELGYGYLSKALHFIERRNKPTVGCADLAKAAAYGVDEVPDLQQKYCR